MLYFVATPIGNLKDISYRAIETLNNADIILCEDTRTSLTFLNAYNIKKPLQSFHKFNYNEVTPKIIEQLKQEKNICLITDAGTPCISDPGSELIEELNKNNLKYTIIPGACAFVNAFCLSGFSAPFMFLGFLPDNKKQKKKILNDIKTQKCTLIFYSAPHNVKSDIKELFESLGDRKVCSVRELTKLHEEIEHFSLKAGYPKEPKGEYVLIIEGLKQDENELNQLSIMEHFEYYLNLGIAKNDAIKQVAKDRGVAKNVIYNQIVSNKKWGLNSLFFT